MANENQLPFDPNKVPDLIRTGKIRIISTPTIPAAPPPMHEIKGENATVERAKNLLGKDSIPGIETNLHE